MQLDLIVCNQCYWGHSLRTKTQRALSGAFYAICFFSMVSVYLLICLFTFLLLQGDMNDWVAFMHGEALIALFFIYLTTAVIGISLTLFFKKELQILNAPYKVLVISFLLTIIIGISVFTYLNFSATQENYAWMHDGLLYQQMGAILFNEPRIHR
jgi:hypothetical protein